MRKSFRLRTAKESIGLKDSQKHILTRTAQRKFASNVQTPFLNEPRGNNNHVEPERTDLIGQSAPLTSSLANQIIPKTEDFISFLCTRDMAHVPLNLEVFANPSTVEIPADEIAEITPDEEQPRIPAPEREPECKKPRLDTNEKDNVKEVQTQPTPTVASLTQVTVLNPTFTEMSDFFPFIESVFYRDDKQHRTDNKGLILVQPYNDWKCLSYVQENLKFEVETFHVHRLKHPNCTNHVLLQCLKKCFEKNEFGGGAAGGVEFKIPAIGFCEVDLPHLMDVVRSFGGADSVNSDQSWKELAEQLHIPRSVSRRAIQLEKIYMQYILPYELLSDGEKSKIQASVTKSNSNTKNHADKYTTSTKKVHIESFHRMSCNAGKCYQIPQDSTVDNVESAFWDSVDKGDRHVASYTGTLDLLENPQSYRNSKAKVAWKISTLYQHEKSSLRYLGKVSNVSSPVLLAESVFATNGDWELDEHGFHMLSYLHAGSEKVWYTIDADLNPDFTKILDESRARNSFVTPIELIEKGINVKRCVQKEGQFVIVEPGSYRFTVNTGYSLSEVVSFAPMRWFHTLNAFDFQSDRMFETKMLIAHANEVIKTGGHQDDHALLVISLNNLKSCILNWQEKLERAGIVTHKYAKNVSTRDVLFCEECDSECFVLDVTISDTDESYCLAHAVKLKRSWRNESVATFIITPNKLSQLVSRIEESQ